MDSSYSFGASCDDDAVVEVASPLAGGDERRLHVRAYDYWMSLLKGRPCPSVEDLDPSRISEFGPNSVLLDFSRSKDNPTLTYLGRALREECGMLYGIRSVADVPEASLLSRLIAQYPDLLANQRPVSFQAEFVSHKGLPTRYRGILMPLSSGGGGIDFVYGVISWKHAPAVEIDTPEQQIPATQGSGETQDPTAPESLAGWLETARAGAEAAQSSEARAHSALYAAIGLAYDFFLAASAAPDDYAGLLAREGLTVQARAPMTPIVKLVFGAHYDKKRLTEYAAALTHARHLGLGRGELAAYLDRYDGGLKALLVAERTRRAPTPKPDPVDRARQALRTVPPRIVVDIDAGTDEFVLLLARRVDQGRFAILNPVTDPALLDQALRKSAPPLPAC